MWRSANIKGFSMSIYLMVQKIQIRFVGKRSTLSTLKCGWEYFLKKHLPKLLISDLNQQCRIHIINNCKYTCLCYFIPGRKKSTAFLKYHMLHALTLDRSIIFKDWFLLWKKKVFYGYWTFCSGTSEWFSLFHCG